MMAPGGERLRRVSLWLLCALVPLGALAADYYGAIAYSPTKRAHGWAKDHPSRRAAEKAARAACSKHASDCASVLWFKNACGALALGPRGAGWAWDPVQENADRAALNACAQHSKACTVKQRICTAR
jgi:serine/threonine-protein kinase